MIKIIINEKWFYLGNISFVNVLNEFKHKILIKINYIILTRLNNKIRQFQTTINYIKTANIFWKFYYVLKCLYSFYYNLSRNYKKKNQKWQKLLCTN